MLSCIVACINNVLFLSTFFLLWVVYRIINFDDLALWVKETHSGLSVLLVEETGENHRPVASH
jgi:hypothetical protein